MNVMTIRRLIIDSITEVAPEINDEEIDADADLREVCDIDSMDFLNFITALKHRTGVSIPERDYKRLQTLNHAVDYMKKKTSYSSLSLG